MSKKLPSPTKRLEQYIDGVSSGKLDVPVFIRKAVEKWKLAAETWHCDHKAFDRAVQIMEMLRCPEGNVKKFSMFPWQCFVLSWMFLFYDGKKRAIREIFLAVPRKAGKSSMFAAATLVNIVEPTGKIASPQVACFGINDETARMTFDKARKILKFDASDLKAGVGGRFTEHYGMRVTKHEIECGKTLGSMYPISAMSHSLEGYTLEGVIADEISQLKNIQPLITLRTGLATANSPQVVMTSTPGDEPHSAYDVELARAMRWIGMKSDGTESGDPPDENLRYAGLVYAATLDDDPSDPKVWARTQPSYHDRGMELFYEEEWNKAQANERDLHGFKTRNLCIPDRLAGAWIGVEEWLATKAPPKEPKRGGGWWHFIGIDLSDVRDMTAICILAVHPQLNRQRVWFEVHYPRGSLPASLNREKNRKQFVENDALLWEKDGWLIMHEGKAIDHKRVAERLVELNKTLNPQVILTDQVSALSEVRRHCTGQTRSKFRTFPKSPRMHSDPLAMLSTWVLEGTLEIEKHPVAERHFRNAEVIQDKIGGRMLDKPAAGSTAKIDAMDALVTAIGGWVNAQDERLMGTEDAPYHESAASLTKGGFQVF